MKKFILCFTALLCMGLSYLYSNDLKGSHYGDIQDTNTKFWYEIDFDFSEDEYNYNIFVPGPLEILNIPESKVKDKYYIENGKYEIKEKKGLETIHFSSKSGHQVMKNKGLLTYGKLLYLVDGQSIVINSFTPDEEVTNTPFSYNYIVSTSSSLTEGNTKYDGQTFYYDNNNLIPWVEGVNGSGIGEWIEFDFNSTGIEYYPNAVVDGFIISNGYVNYDKPKLYKANNRVRKLLIECEEKDINYTVEINDTSAFQLVKLPKELGKDHCKVRITIESIYEGNKWDNTVINRIIPISTKYIK